MAIRYLYKEKHYNICCSLWILLIFALPLHSQSYDKEVSLLYTGKSLGVLGYTRFQAEHDLLTEVANQRELPFKLVSHACWRAKDITIFLPSDEPEGWELEEILIKMEEWTDFGFLSAIKSDDALLLQDPDRNETDLLALMRENLRYTSDFPDFQKDSVRLFKTFIGEDSIKCVIVQKQNASFPSSLEQWEIGEVNRVDLGKTSRLFEIPVNHGNFAARSTVIKKVIAANESQHGYILVDLGNRHGDFDIDAIEYTKIDFEGLDRLNYQILLPYQQELIGGSVALKEVSDKYPDIELLASNINSKIPGLFKKSIIARYDNLSVGFIGMCDPELELEMPKELLEDYTFLPLQSSIQEAVNQLRSKRVDVIIGLSNMNPSANAKVSESVKGIDFIVSDFSQSNHVLENTLQLANLNKHAIRPGIPKLTTRSNDYGMALGKLDLFFDHNASLDSLELAAAHHKLYPINDRIQGDTALMRVLKKDLEQVKRPKGELLFPAFVDIIEQEPSLQDYDETTKNGRISKALWEEFLARLIRNGTPSELAILRRVPSFIPQIGKLHEREVRAWLWVEDDIVMLDVLGKDLTRFLEAEIDDRYVTSGVNSFVFRGQRFWMVMGRFVVPNAYYRLATTNVIRDGAGKEYFNRGLRNNDKFIINPNLTLKSKKDGKAVKFRDYVLEELKYIRSKGKGKIHHDNIAQLLTPDPRFEKLTTFNFARPTLWTSLNRTYKNEGYESVPESRILSQNSFVIGIDGGLSLTADRAKSSWDIGGSFAFAEQSAELANGITQVTENADDLRFGLTYNFKGKNRNKLSPFIRAEYDTEFTPTINGITGLENPLQKVGRGIIGFSRFPNRKWRRLEIGLSGEKDFANQIEQLGIQGRSLARFPLNKNFSVTYVLRNDFNYYFDAKNDSPRDLRYKYNMVHELLVPLFGDISLSVAADLFFYKGKVELNNQPGLNMLMKVGITYDRLWKPRYQALF